MNFAIILVVFCSLLSLGQGYKEVCYDQLGCFTDAPPWGDTPERPMGYVPLPPEKINTRFYLDTRQVDDVEVYNDDMVGLDQAGFDYTKPTKFIIHGYVQNGDTSWMIEMSSAIRQADDANIIRTGWVGGSLTLNYAQSATDIQVVGAEVGLFIMNIVKHFKGTTKSFHCIGHSLGAQACGYLGSSVSPKVARISGLDPAGPYFEDTPIEVRLDPTDADFVDVLHTDAEKLITLGLGTNQVSGHVDFWPNNGIQQPGCDQNILSTITDNGIVDGTVNFVACNHMRAVSFYTESITSSCPFSGNACDSYEDYLEGKCLDCTSGKCTAMGFRSINNADAVYALAQTRPSDYLQTRDQKPYCSCSECLKIAVKTNVRGESNVFMKYMTYVEVTLGSSGDSIDGRLYLTLYGPTGNTEQEQLSDEGVKLELRPQTTYSYVAQYNNFPDNFNRVKLLWMKDDFAITSQHITVAQIKVWVDFQQKEYTFCGDSNAKLNEEVRYSYYAC